MIIGIITLASSQLASALPDQCSKSLEAMKMGLETSIKQFDADSKESLRARSLLKMMEESRKIRPDCEVKQKMLTKFNET